MPGADVKSILLPVNQVSMRFALDNEWTFLGQYKLEFKEVELNPVGELSVACGEDCRANPCAAGSYCASGITSDGGFDCVADALARGRPGAPVDLRLFSKPNTLKNRRMGVALAGGETADEAVAIAKAAAGAVKISYR